MSRNLRIILIVVGVILVLLVIAPFLIPVNQFKPTIEAKASEALGRKVEMGNLSLSLWSGSLSAENLVVGDDPKFSPSPFLTAKKINVGVEVMPLIFSRTLNITSISIKNPQVTLLHNASGQWNYSSIGGSAANAPAAQAPATQAPAAQSSSSQIFPSRSFPSTTAPSLSATPTIPSATPTITSPSWLPTFLRIQNFLSPFPPIFPAAANSSSTATRDQWMRKTLRSLPWTPNSAPAL